MSLSTGFIRRPVATVLAMAAILVTGVFAAVQLPVSALPAIEAPVIRVSTTHPGANAETMAATVTTPLEARLSQLPSLVSIASESSFGGSTITLQFALSRNIDSAAQDVQSAITSAAGDLPAGLANPPVYNKVNPADAPIVALALTSRTVSLAQINDYADTILGQRLAQIEGVGLVSTGGERKRAIRVAVDPAKLAQRGLILDDLRVQIARLSATGPEGSIEGPRQSLSLATEKPAVDAARYRDLVLSENAGSIVRLQDVARVEDGIENRRISGWYNDQPALIVLIHRQPTANVVAAVDRVMAALPALQASLPAAVTLAVVSDRTTSIRASLQGVRLALIHAIIIVGLVLLVSLRRLWPTLITAAAIPLSLAGTFAIMHLAGYSIDNLSLMALTVAVGFVVDDAIVMVENIVRQRERGLAPIEAAIEGAREIGFTIASLTISLIAVFVPLLFMGSMTGRLFREFGVTLSVAVAVSAVVSLTFTPMLCARLPARKPTPDEKAPLLARVYERALAATMRHRPLVHASTALALLATVVLFLVIPKGLMPVQDTGLITAVLDVREDAAFEVVQEKARLASQIVLADPDVASIQGFAGVNLENPDPNGARFTVTLRPHETRSHIDVVIGRLSAALAELTGTKVFMQANQELTLSSQQSRGHFQLRLQDSDRSVIERWAPVFAAALAARPELQDVASHTGKLVEQIGLVVDRDRAALYGISVKAIDDALYDAFGQRPVATIYTQVNQYRVILELDPTLPPEARSIDRIHLRSSDGALVPLSAIVMQKPSHGAMVVHHLGRLPVATLSFNLARPYALGDAARAVESIPAAIGLPERVVVAPAGSLAEFTASQEHQLLLVIAAVLTVYVVLGILYESFVHPITVLSTLPSAGLGALSALMLSGYPLDLVGMIGILLLIGIAKKNAIMMIDFALQAQKKRGLSAEAAVLEAARLRFRPIMMTTMAALLGALPFVFDTSAGYELRRPLGIAIVGGLLVSQFLTLFSTPALFVLFDNLSRRAVARRGLGGASPGSIAE